MPRIEFNPDGHTYRVDGIECVSVTTALRVIEAFRGDLARVPYDVLERARIFGTHVHAAAAMLVRGELDWARLDPALAPCMEGVRNFLKHSGFIPLSVELPIGCSKRRVAGTLDIRGLWKRRRRYGIVDWKSASMLPSTVGEQTAAYDQLYRDMHGGPAHQRDCVLLGAQFPLGFKVHALDSPTDWSLFQSALNIYHAHGPTVGVRNAA